MIESHAKPILVKDTEIGTELYRQIDDLKMLIKAYNSGLIKEK